MNRTVWSAEHLCNICTVITNPYLRVSGSACPRSLSDRRFEFIYDANTSSEQPGLGICITDWFIIASRSPAEGYR